MSRDPFPVDAPPETRHLRRRYAGATIDPLEIALAKQEAREAEIRELVSSGHTPDADPIDLRGIPVIGRGVAGRVRVHPDELR